MIDWISAFYCLRAPDGSLVDPKSIPGLCGHSTLTVDAEGVVVSERSQPKRYAATAESSMYSVKVQARCDSLWIHGNPASFVQGHGCYTNSPPWHCEEEMRRLLLLRWELPGYHLELQRITRLDLTQEVDCDNLNRCGLTLKAMRHGWSAPRKSHSTFKHTIYLGQKAKGDWTLKAYQKALKELSGKPNNLSEFLRLELCLRPGGMELAGLDGTAPYAWDLEAVFASFLGRCRLSLGNQQARPVPPDGLKGAHLGVWYEWMDGRNPKARMASATYHRARKGLLGFGVDIAIPPNPEPPADGARPLSWQEIQDPTRWHGTAFTPQAIEASRIERAMRRITGPEAGLAAA